MSKQFKAGDKVRCIDITGWFDFTEGSVYEVSEDSTPSGVRFNKDDRGHVNTPLPYRFEIVTEPAKPANVFELKGYTEGGMYVDHRYVSGHDEAKQYIDSAAGPSNAASYKLFEIVPVGEFKVSSVTTRTVETV